MLKQSKTFQFSILNYDDFKETVEIVSGKPYNLRFRRALYTKIPFMIKTKEGKYIPQKVCFSADVTAVEASDKFEAIKEELIRKAYQDYLNTATGIQGIRIYEEVDNG